MAQIVLCTHICMCMLPMPARKPFFVHMLSSSITSVDDVFALRLPLCGDTSASKTLTVSAVRLAFSPDCSANEIHLRVSASKLLLHCKHPLQIIWYQIFLYVGAACHPQPRVTGVANRLRRSPCSEGELMLWYDILQ